MVVGLIQFESLDGTLVADRVSLYGIEFLTFRLFSLYGQVRPTDKKAKAHKNPTYRSPG